MKSKITLLSFIALFAFARHATSQEPMPALPFASDEELTHGVPNPPVIDPATGAVLNPAAAKLLAEQAAWERRIPNLTVDSHPLGDLIANLRTKFPEINFVVPESGLEKPVSLRLQSVTLAEILRALEISSEGMIRAQRDSSSPRIVAFRVDKRPEPQESKPVLRAYNLENYLRVSIPRMTMENGEPETDRLRENRREQLKEKKIQSLHHHLEMSFAMMQLSDPDNDRIKMPLIEFSRNSDLLIAVGTPESLQIVDEVVRALISQERNLQPELLDVDIEQ